jgi:hypothetical protein
MDLRPIVIAGLLVAATAPAQERAARPMPVLAQEARPASAMSKAGLPGSALEISYDARLAAQQARDIKQLKSQMALLHQVLENQQAEIAQLHACLKLHDQRLAGMPMMGSGVVGSGMPLNKPLSDYRFCKTM